MPPRGYKKNKTPAQVAGTSSITVGGDPNVLLTVTGTTVQTDEQLARKETAKVPTLEKSSEKEKDSGAVLIFSWTENGKRFTKQWTCATVNVHENSTKTYLKSGTKTTLDISIEAQVIEVL